MQAKYRPTILIPLLLAALPSGCTTTPEAPRQAQITDEVTAKATVVAIDGASRQLTLQGAEGPAMVLVAGPEVRNFDQIEVGDTLTANYTVTVSARRLEADEFDTQEGAGIAAARADEGQKPGAAIGAGMAMTVVVKSVDREQNIVVFTDPEGAIHAIEAQRDVGRRFIAGLEPGDRVELVYGEALALAVE